MCLLDPALPQTRCATLDKSLNLPGPHLGSGKDKLSFLLDCQCSACRLLRASPLSGFARIQRLVHTSTQRIPHLQVKRERICFTLFSREGKCPRDGRGSSLLTNLPRGPAPPHVEDRCWGERAVGRKAGLGRGGSPVRMGEGFCTEESAFN